ncbi:MAG: DUF2029 domain-containing protein [Desulfobacterales bacterium]|nr:DUF2029 domain-containing protein [Desulfobacterales bacterium]
MTIISKLFNWKNSFLLFSYIVITLNILAISIYYPKAGWDFSTYCGAVDAFYNGHDPYMVEQLDKYAGTGLSFVYPPLAIPVLSIPCSFNNIKTSYYAIWILLISATLFIVKICGPDTELFYFFTLIITGFISTFWCFFTGNIGLFELFILSLIFLCILKKSYYTSSFLIAVIGSMKIIPLFFAIPKVFMKIPLKKKITLLLFLCAAFFLIHTISYTLFPGISRSYYSSLMGNIPDQHAPIKETGGIGNSSLYFFIQANVMKYAPNVPFLPRCLYLLSVTAISVCFWRFFSANKHISSIEIFSYGLLAVIIFLPRLKPYSFTSAILPVYFLTRKWEYKKKFMVIVIVSLLPGLFFTGSHYFNGILFQYGQLFSLLSIYISIPWLISQSAQENQNAEYSK